MFRSNLGYLQVARKAFIELCAAYDLLMFKLRNIKQIYNMLNIRSVVTTQIFKNFLIMFCYNIFLYKSKMTQM
jgi:hypothetical protein